jgi:hypothetical protein
VRFIDRLASVLLMGQFCRVMGPFGILPVSDADVTQRLGLARQSVG